MGANLTRRLLVLSSRREVGLERLDLNDRVTGMASRALIARLRIALSTSPGLAEVWHGSGDNLNETVTCSPSDRLSSSTVR